MKFTKSMVIAVAGCAAMIGLSGCSTTNPTMTSFGHSYIDIKN